MKDSANKSPKPEPNFTAESPPIQPGRIPRERVLFFLILSAAVAIRLWHVDWDLPQVYEEAYPFSVAWKFWSWGRGGFDFNPHIFNYAALTFYVQFAVQLIHYAVGHLLGIYSDPNAFRSAYEANPTVFLILARLVSVAFDAGTIAVAYALARRFAGQSVALLTCALIAINPLHIKESHLVNVDTPLTFFVMLSLYFIVRVFDEPSTKWYLFAGLSIGLSAATKYTGALLLPVLLVAHLLRSRTLAGALTSLWNVRLFYTGALSGLVFIVLNPFIVLSFNEFYGGFSFIYYNVIEYGHLGVVPSKSTLGFYLLESIPNHLGLPLTVGAGLSILYIIVERDRRHLLLLIFPIFYLLVISRWEYRADRYILPALPTLMLTAAIGLTALQERLSKLPAFAAPAGGKGLTVIRAGVNFSLVALVAVPAALQTYRYEISHSLADTRTVAMDWITKNIRPGSAIATIPIGMTLPGTFLILPIPYHPVLTSTTLPFYDTRFYSDLDMVISTSFDYERYKMEPGRYGKFLEFYDSIRAGWSLVREFDPGGRRFGPEIRLYQSPRDSTDRPFESSVVPGLRDVENQPSAVNFAGKLGLILSVKGKLKKSEELLRFVTELDPGNVAAHAELASLYQREGDYEHALNEIDTVLTLDPSRKKMVSLKANIYLELGRFADAEKGFQRVLAIDDHDVAAYESLMMLYGRQNDRPKLIELLERYRNVLPPEKARLVDEEVRKLKG
jgi:hypothetical protein